MVASILTLVAVVAVVVYVLREKPQDREARAYAERRRWN